MNYIFPSRPTVRQCTKCEGGAYGRGHLQSILPDRDGIRNSRHALDTAARTRTPVWFKKVQRVAAGRAEDVAGASVEAPKRPRSSGNRDAVKSDGRTGAL